MIVLRALIGVAAVLLLAPAACRSASEPDWAAACEPQLCRCKWVSGQKLAECANSSLTAVPRNLSNEVQVLDVSYNTVLELNKDAFRSAGLINLHKLIARGCSIELVDKDAFRGLQILIELDLSDNNIHVLHPATFRDPFRLRRIHLNRNPIQRLQNGLFSNMSFLQAVEFNGCLISQIEPKTFYNVTKFNSLELSGNKLVNVKSEVLDSVPSLMNLEIANNPWRCDCKLRPFRDSVVNKNLKPAACAEPARLVNRLWNDIRADEFACQPVIQYPGQSSTFELVDDERLTVGCKVYGEPGPGVQWVFNNRPISNYSHGDYKFAVHESVDNTMMAKWINLTVSRSRLTGKSEFKCIAQNAAGLDERKITVIVQNNGGGKGILGTTVGVKESLPIIVGLVTGIFVIVLLLIVCCLCCCRRRPDGVQSKKSHANGFSNGDVPNNNHRNHVTTSLVSEPSEQQKSLLVVVNPVQKPPRRYESSSPTGTEMTELKRNLLDETSISGDTDEQQQQQCYAGGESGDEVGSIGDGSVVGGSGGGGGPHHHHLHHQNRSYRMGATAAGTPTTTTHPPDLLAFPRGGPVSSLSSSTIVPPSFALQQSPLHSPVYSSGTLPYNRSQSPFNSARQPSSGYVTIPRRPRAPSWAPASASGASTPCGAGAGLVDDPLGMAAGGRLCEPVYDNLGPRTTADGSSVLSLTKALAAADAASAVHRHRPAPPPQYSQTLPHKAKLLHQGGAGPAAAVRSRLRFDSDPPDSGGGGSGNRTGGVLQPPSPPPLAPTPDAKHNNTLPPNYSPLVEMLDARNRSSWAPGNRGGTPETGVLKPPTGQANGGGSSVKRRKVPPKPPPKPKIKGGPLFEDEGEDGTEV